MNKAFDGVTLGSPQVRCMGPPPHAPQRTNTFAKGRDVTLAKNKKLVLSIVLNMLLAVALTMLLRLVYPECVYRLESVSNWDRYSVRTYRTDSGFAYFEVLLGPEERLGQPCVPRRIYSSSGEERFSVESFGWSSTENGVPNLIVSQYLGGAHGNSRYLPLELHDSVVRQFDVVDGLAAEVQDVNHDGMPEITGVDGAYGYFLGGCYADSPFPQVVLSFDKAQAKFVLDRKLMSKPPLPQDRLEQLSLKYKSDPRWSEESRPPSDLFVTMLNLIYTGNEEQAWELFHASWPDGSAVSREEYREDVKGELSHSHFYPAIAGWNKAKS
ncbi:hypothetical protein [Petrachloros mirabilis]